MLALMAGLTGGCVTIRVTDPPRSATEQFLESQATKLSIAQLSTDALRDRKVYLDWQYLTGAKETAAEHLYCIGELRSKLLTAGVRLVEQRSQAQIILEVRSGGIGIDRQEFLLGLSSLPFPTGLGTGGAAGQVAVNTPELALLKTTKQRGYADVAFVAYWADSGEVVASSGPFVGRTLREDYWVLGTLTSTVGNIPPAQK
jgi:hypothetical protein